MDHLAASLALDAIYARIPDVGCRGKCAGACGPILCSEPEWERVMRHGEISRAIGTYDCTALKGGRCTAYAVRPLVCRLYGAVKEMRCQHGCRPKRWVTDAEADAMLREVRELAGGRIAGPAVGLIWIGGAR